MTTQPAHTPLRARTVNAEDFTSPEIREKLFTPNAESNSAYDLLADPQGTYILVAERGMGKTHALLVLEDQLEKRGDIVLHISPKSRKVINTYLELNKQIEYKDKNLSTKWQLAILEFLGLKLLDPSLGLRNKWIMFSKKRIKVLVKYYQKYQSDELGNQLKNWTKQLKDSSKSALTEFLISVETLIGKLTASGKAEKEKQEITPPTLEGRIGLIGDWVWDSLAVLRNLKYPISESNPMTRFLPKSKSVYVVADGLDQIDEINNLDLLGLVDAVKLLNEKSKDKLKSDEPNFKMIIALRAITYDYFIGDEYKNTTHLWGNIKRLSWDSLVNKNADDKDMHLKKLLANFIAAYYEKEISELGTEKIIDLIFPKEVIYFGRRFTPGVKFILDYTERRPREILLLWQAASEQVDSGELYSANLSAQDLVDGLKNYSTNQLPKDIGTEYEAEFPGIRPLLTYLSENRESTTRVVSKNMFTNLIDEYIKEIDEKDIQPWLKKGSNNVLKILYHVGIVGILPSEEPYDLNWPRALYAKDNPDKSLENASSIVIRPAFWSYLTNIKTETSNRRDHLLYLYRELQAVSYELGDLLDSVADPKTLDVGEFEFSLGRFLVLCDSVEKFSGHPEPSDWETWKLVNNRLQSVYNQFTNTPFCTGKIELGRMIEEYKKVVVGSQSTEYGKNIDFTDLERFKSNIQDNIDYKKATHSMQKWFNVRQKDNDPKRIESFRKSLNIEEESLYSVLGTAISNLVNLIESNRGDRNE